MSDRIEHVSWGRRLAPGVIAVLLFAAGAARAGAPGSTSAQFLKIPPGARAAAMGQAYCGLADDVDAIVWNPAGLAQIDGVQQTFMHNSWLEGINQEYAAFAMRLNPGSAFGVAVEYVNVGDITRLDRMGNDRGSYNAYDLLGSVSYGRALRPSFAVGASLKVLQEKIESETARAFALDAGVFYRWSDRFRFGGSLRNIGTAVTFRNTGYPLPLDLRAGMSYLLRENVTVVADLDFPSDSSAGLNVGGEYWYRRLKGMELAVRGGFRSGSMSALGATAGLSMGFGIRWNNWGADYALSPLGVLGMSHRLNFSMRFSATTAAVKEVRKTEIVIQREGQQKVVTPDEMYQQALQWFAAKAEKERLSADEQLLLLGRMKQKFEALGVTVSSLSEMMEKLKQ